MTNNIINFAAKRDLVREIDEVSKKEKRTQIIASVSLVSSILCLLPSLSIFGGAVVNNISLNIPTVVASFASLFVGLGLGSFSIVNNEIDKALKEEWLDLVNELNYIEDEEEKLKITKEVMKNEHMEEEYNKLYQEYIEDDYYNVQNKPKTLSRRIIKFPKNN